STPQFFFQKRPPAAHPPAARGRIDDQCQLHGAYSPCRPRRPVAAGGTPEAAVGRTDRRPARWLVLFHRYTSLSCFWRDYPNRSSSLPIYALCHASPSCRLTLDSFRIRFVTSPRTTADSADPSRLGHSLEAWQWRQRSKGAPPPVWGSGRPSRRHENAPLPSFWNGNVYS